MYEESYPYERPFRLRILAACLHKNWYVGAGSLTAQPEYFHTKEERLLVEFINNYYTTYHHAPCVDEIAAEFTHNDELMQDLIVDVVEILDTKSAELEYVKTKAVEFARKQATWAAIATMATMCEQGKSYDELRKVFNEAGKVGQDAQDLGIDLVKDRAKWIYSNSEDAERITTGIQHLDQLTGGGLGRGEYGLVIASSGVGKSRTLVNFGIGAASLMSKANVLHITLEMPARNLARRYGARLTGRIHSKGDEITLDNLVVSNANIKLHGSIRIKQFPNKRLSISDLMRYLDTLSIEGFEPDMLIMDYSTNMRHNAKLDYRQQLADTSEELRGLAVERNMALWDAAQANRAAVNKEILGNDDIAECYDQIATADGVITICQTKPEKAENTLRLHISKWREEESNTIITCKVDPVLHIIESTGHLTLVEWLERKAENNGKQLQIIKEESKK